MCFLTHTEFSDAREDASLSTLLSTLAVFTALAMLTQKKNNASILQRCPAMVSPFDEKSAGK